MQMKKNENSHVLRLIKPQTQHDPEHMFLRFLTSVEKIVNRRRGFRSFDKPEI